MAIFSYSARVDEAVVARDQSTGRARTYLPPLTKEREAALGRIFGFVELNIPRTPQVDELLAAIDRELMNAYGQGSLRPGENYEEYFENAVRRIEKRVSAVAAERRIKLDRGNINAVFGVLFGLNIRLVSHGNVNAYLVRRLDGKPTKVVDILSGLDGEPDDDGRLLSSVVCGEIGPHDVIVMMNKTMSETVPISDFLASTREADEAALGSHLRSLALTNIPSSPAVGLVLRTVAVKLPAASNENISVKKMLSREEEVARVLAPSGIPKLHNVIEKLKPVKDGSKEKRPFGPRPLVKNQALSDLVDQVNRFPRRAKISLLVAIALIGIFFLSAEIISLKNNARTASDAYAASLKQVSNLADEAESALIYDEPRSAELLAEAGKDLTALPQKTKQQKSDVGILTSRLSALGRRLNHVFDVKPAIVGEISGSVVALSVSSGAVLAVTGNNLYKLSSGTAQNIATFPAAAKWQAKDGDKLFYALQNGTFVFVDPKNPLPQAIAAADAADARAGGFWNGRLYAVASDGMQVLRLSPVVGGYAGATPWLKAAPAAAIATIAIDGTIYAAIKGKGIIQYVKGAASSFKASASSVNDDPLALAIGNNLYLLGGQSAALGAGSTIAEWDPKGNLLAQYSLPAEAGKATAFAIDEAAKTIYIGTDSGKIMEFSIAK